jgi:hypothetical protein
VRPHGAKSLHRPSDRSGAWAAFVTGELQNLCEPCHNSAKRQVELRGYRCDVGINGFPTDPNQSFNRAG